MIRKGLILICYVLTAYTTAGQTSSADYKSKVPKFTFSNNLEQQEQELKNNPLVLRMNESRKQLSSDKWRPVYHYVNPEGNLNDPNGLCFWQGNWHLFYQGYPPEDPRQHWGHAISKDLVHWRDLPYAIYPDPERAVFSGSTYVDGDKVVAMYHGTMAGNMVAVSSDPLLLNWQKVTGKAVIPLKSSTGFTKPYSVFDPCIWKKDSVYYSLSASRTNTGPGGKPVRSNFLFKSLDLAHWEFVHEFVENDRFTLIGDDGACPYFWPIGNKYIMNFFSHMSGGQYLLGDYDTKRDKFVVTSGGKYNHGAVGPAGVHAPSATPDGNGGVIIIFNMNPGRTTKGWNQIMSLPRKLTLSDRDILLQEPAGDIASLRYNNKHLGPMTLNANKEMVLPGISGNTMEIDAEIDPKNAQMVEINVLRSPGREEYTRIVFYRDKGFGSGLEYVAGEGTVAMPADLLALYTGKQGAPRDRSTASLISLETAFSSSLPDTRFRPPETASFKLDAGETVKLKIFIDRSIVEVFANGKQVVAARVYPDRKDSLGVSIRSNGDSAELKSFDAWQMKNIYE
jgi:beta-fructofuranosidase